jgi:hypothetical protein
MHATKLLVAALAAAGAVQAAEITIYKQPNFAGGEQTFNRDTASLQGTGVYDQSKSVVVRSGRWQVCSQPNFQGDCQMLDRGQYASLPQQLSGRIESLREVTQMADADEYSRWRYEGGGWRERANWRRGGGEFRGGDYRNDRGYATSGRAAIVLFADGNATRYDRDMDDLFRTQFRDGAERIVIREGRWEICAQPDYRGICRVYEPGLYTNLGRFGSQIGSLRRVG